MKKWLARFIQLLMVLVLYAAWCWAFPWFLWMFAINQYGTYLKQVLLIHYGTGGSILAIAIFVALIIYGIIPLWQWTNKYAIWKS